MRLIFIRIIFCFFIFSELSRKFNKSNYMCDIFEILWWKLSRFYAECWINHEWWLMKRAKFIIIEIEWIQYTAVNEILSKDKNNYLCYYHDTFLLFLICLERCTKLRERDTHHYMNLMVCENVKLSQLVLMRHGSLCHYKMKYAHHLMNIQTKWIDMDHLQWDNSVHHFQVLWYLKYLMNHHSDDFVLLMPEVTYSYLNIMNNYTTSNRSQNNHGLSQLTLSRWWIYWVNLKKLFHRWRSFFHVE